MLYGDYGDNVTADMEGVRKALSEINPTTTGIDEDHINPSNDIIENPDASPVLYRIQKLCIPVVETLALGVIKEVCSTVLLVSCHETLVRVCTC